MLKTELAKKIEADYYRSLGINPLSGILQGLTTQEVRFATGYSEVMHFDVDISTKIGPIKMNLPFFSAAMNSVSGQVMLERCHEAGACGVTWRDIEANDQLDRLEKALKYKACLVPKPEILLPNSQLKEARHIKDRFDFSTIPIVSHNGVLQGILFTGSIAFKGHENEPVKNWMIPFEKLKVDKDSTSFEDVQKRLLNEPLCSLLPVVDSHRCLKGIYFMADFFHINPSWHNSKPLVGMAVSDNAEDISRVHAGLEIGVGVIVLDSSHGNSKRVIEQAKRIIEITKHKAAVIVGNVADIDGYVRLSEIGVDAVKFGIGPGATCTTSIRTGAGYPMFSLMREARFARKYMKKNGKHAAFIIADGGVSNTGDMSVTLASAHGLMMGEYFVAFSESESFQVEGLQYGPDGKKNWVSYWGMASEKAIKEKLSVRYGLQKRAAEGIEGLVPYRGPMLKNLSEDIELLKGGISHQGAKDLKTLRELCDDSRAFSWFSSFGNNQNTPRLKGNNL